MSYQVLARKWRPQNFKQMVGQEHVLKALIHALESQRLHHAYLFTGTRGVGKTTIGRILAKCLSCHSGITAEPCGQCGACTGIVEGRYVDLIEIDAASRTKVEDMRELLENVQYAPSEGRYKIYLIDEVHMLSTSSFNALLKTLEEPPEHVKFLFATTDPQKLPVTILSRCLQFNLKNMSPERIVEHLKHILHEESVGFEEPALWALARAADGSMRDALSLTDQAIAYGNHQLMEDGVSAMLGTVDQKRIYRILDALVTNDAQGMMAEVAALSEFSPDYAAVLASLLSIVHRIAIEQAVPGACDNAMGDQEAVQRYARQLTPEDVQLFYQIALVSRKDLAISPDPRAGLEMALLRMLAFQLERPAQAPVSGLSNSPEPVNSPEPSSNPEPQGEATLHNTSASPATADTPASLESNAGAELVTPSAEQTSAPVVSEPASSAGSDLQAPINEPALSGQVGSSQFETVPLEAYEQSVAMAQASDDANAAFERVAELDSGKKKTELNALESEHASAESPAPACSTAAPELGAISPLPQVSSAPINEPATAPLSDRRLDPPALAASEPELKQPGSANSEPSAINTELGWPQEAVSLGLTGMTQNLLLNMFKTQQGDQIQLNVESGHFRLLNKVHESRITEAFKARFGAACELSFIEGLQHGQETPMMWRERRQAERLLEAKQAVRQDPNVIQLLEVFDAVLVEDSVEALGELS